jgi:hypothetical protein
MASKSQVSSVQDVVRAPDGFRRVGSVANAGWYNQKKIGNVCQGVIENMYERKDELSKTGMSKFFQVKLSQDCEVRMGRGEDAAVSVVKAGEYANVNYGPKTRELEKLIPQILQGAEFEVYIVVLGEKIKLGGGKAMHNIDVLVKQTKAAASLEEPDFSGDDVVE